MLRHHSRSISSLLSAAIALLLAGCANELSVRAQSKRIDELSSRTIRVEEGIDKLRERIDTVHDEVITLSSQERKADRELAALRAAMPRVEQRIAETEARRARLEDRVRAAESGNAELKEAHQHLNVLLAEVERELEALRGGADERDPGGHASGAAAAGARARLEQLQGELLRVRAAIRSVREDVGGDTAARQARAPVPAGSPTGAVEAPPAGARPPAPPEEGAATSEETGPGKWQSGWSQLARHPAEVALLIVCALAIVAPIVWLGLRRRRLRASAGEESAAASPAAPAAGPRRIVRRKLAAAAAAALSQPETDVESELDAAAEPDPEPDATAAAEAAEAAESADAASPGPVSDGDAAAALEPASPPDLAPVAPGEDLTPAAASVPRPSSTAPRAPAPVKPLPAAAPPGRSSPRAPAQTTGSPFSQIEDVVKALDMALPTAEQVSRAYAARQVPADEEPVQEGHDLTQLIGQPGQTSAAKTDILDSATDDLGETEDARETVLVGAVATPPGPSKPAMTPAPRPVPTRGEELDQPTLALDAVEQPGMTQVISAPGDSLRDAREKETARGNRARADARGATGGQKKPRRDKELLAELEQIIGYKMDDRR